MRMISINAIKGNEVIAKDVYSEFDTILMPVGTVLKKEYAYRLKDLNITHVFIEDELATGVKVEEMTELKIKEDCEKIVKETLDRFIQCGNVELENIKVAAQKIIFNLLEQPKVIYNMSGIRNHNEGVYAHSINVSGLAVFLALRMKLSKEKVNEIAIGSLLHDIGHKYMKEKIRDIEYNQLNEKEKKELKMHVIYGYSALEYESWIPKRAKDIIINHHEHMDGSGYPRHLEGEKVKLFTNIVTVCDLFDRMVYGIYEKPMKIHKVIEYIVGQGGLKFDLDVVKVFNASIAAYPNGTIILTNEGEVGIVLRQNASCPTRPVIRMLKKASGEFYEQWVEKDLIKELSLFIEDTMTEEV